MTARTEHDAIRDLLKLAVAGALDQRQQSALDRHLAGCRACAAELDAWRELVGSLKRLPTPQAPAGLVERVRVGVEAQLAAEAERRWNQWVMVFSVLFAWTVTLAGWPIVRLLTRGVAGWLDLHFTQPWLSLVGYTTLSWLTAGVAAIALGLWHRRARRTA